jgi:enoyl-CoA hydratase
MSYENIRLEVDGQVAVLTVDRPKALNALNSRTLTEIHQAADEVAKRREVRALIVTGGGEKAFVAGADIAEMAELPPEEARRFSEIGHRAFAALEALPVPTIAAINGFALGGGLELALGCDLLYASEKAKLGFPEVSLAVVPGFGGTQRLTRLVGKMRAQELVFTGEPVSAARAKEIGLVLDVLPPEGLMPHCRAVAQTIAGRGPLGVQHAKRVMNVGADQDLRAACELEQQTFGLLFGTADQKEGMRAFLEKRKPSYTGR